MDVEDADGRLARVRLPEGVEGVARFHELVAPWAEEPAEVVIATETDRGLFVSRRLDTALGRGDRKAKCWPPGWPGTPREVYAVSHPDDAGQLLEPSPPSAHFEFPELRRLGGTLGKWRTEIINRHRTGNSNRPTEAMNLLIKQIKRVAGASPLRAP